MSVIDVEKLTLDCVFCNPAKAISVNQCYILQDKVEVKQEADIRILFLIDKSGSMGRTNLPDMHDRSPLEILAQLIKKKLTEIGKTNPKSIVGVIFFNDTINVVGDACGPTFSITENKLLTDIEQIRALVKDQSQYIFCHPIEKSLEKLVAAISDDDATNQTALGPAIVAGLELLKGGNSGSKMLIFTDGVANIGVGNLDPESGPLDKKFYEDVASKARNEGIEISLYKISSQDCSMEVYSALTSETCGSILGVDPSLITEQVVIQDKVPDLAREVDVTLRIPDIFKFTLILDPKLLPKRNVFHKTFGRIVEDTFDVLQFEVNAACIAGKDVEKLEQVPFQLSLKYVSPVDHTKYQMVITKMLKVMHARTEKEFEPEIMHAYINKLVQEGARHVKLADVEAALGDLLENYIKQDTTNPHAEELIEYTKGLQKEINPMHVSPAVIEDPLPAPEEKKAKPKPKPLPEEQKAVAADPTAGHALIGKDGMVLTTTVPYKKMFPKKHES